MLSVLVLGGYGFFGTRIAKSLAADGRTRVLVAGRNLDRAASTARELAAIRIGITSGARAPGLATVRGIFGYLGLPFERLENGV